MRFGPGHRSDAERNRKDLTLEDALALKAQIPEMRAVSPERYLWDTDVHVEVPRRARPTTPDGRRRRSRLLARQQPLRRARAVHHRGGRRARVDRSPSSATDVQQGALPARETRSNKTVELNGWKYTVVGVLEEKGELRRRLQQQLVPHPVHDVRPAVPATSRTAAATRSTSRRCPYRPEQVPIDHREGPGAPARAPARALQQAETTSHLHARQDDRELPGHHARHHAAR